MAGSTINASTSVNSVHRLAERIGGELTTLLRAEEVLRVVCSWHLPQVRSKFPARFIADEHHVGMLTLGLRGVEPDL
jgi:hypothetical protein